MDAEDIVRSAREQVKRFRVNRYVRNGFIFLYSFLFSDARSGFFFFFWNGHFGDGEHINW